MASPDPDKLRAIKTLPSLIAYLHLRLRPHLNSASACPRTRTRAFTSTSA